MGFYHGSSKPPQDDQGSLKEAMLITWVVFKTLALPLGVLIGTVAGLIVLFYLFAWHPLVGLAGIGLIVAAVIARGIWEAKHPPTLP